LASELKDASIEIRRATPDDAQAISDLLLEAFSFVREYYTDEAFAYTTPPAEAIIPRFDEGPMWVATDGNAIVGTVSGLAEPNRYYIRSMAVKRGMQGKGIGQRLLDELEQFARDAGHTRSYLYTTHSLTGARQLYEKNGFKLIRETPPEEFFGTAGIEMEKELKY
jgi:ribosomal protein S18 acetylase RimI-like enzyme